MVDVVYHPEYQAYDFGPEHPFSPLRLEMLWTLLEAWGQASEPRAPSPASRDDVLTVHDEAFVDQVEAASYGTPRPEAEHFGLGTMDVPTFARMDEAARWLVGGTLEAARCIAAGEADKVLQLGGGLHHAQRARAAGFCVYNDLAVAIRHCTAAGLHVAYIDIDVHHGDGVQQLHYDEREVLTISLHESGRYLYPGTGYLHEMGEGGGKGFKLNVPLEPYTTDDSFLQAFEQVVPHALSWFQPDLLLIQCGADAHFRDPLADLLLTTRGFATLFRRLLELADQYAGGRAVFTLGGGYDPDATTRVWALLYLILQDQSLPDRLPDDWLTAWQERLHTTLVPTLHDDPPAFSIPNREALEHQNRQTCRRLMATVVQYWY